MSLSLEDNKFNAMGECNTILSAYTKYLYLE